MLQIHVGLGLDYSQGRFEGDFFKGGRGGETEARVWQGVPLARQGLIAIKILENFFGEGVIKICVCVWGGIKSPQAPHITAHAWILCNSMDVAHIVDLYLRTSRR